jgi:hypothetical protein
MGPKAWREQTLAAIAAHLATVGRGLYISPDMVPPPFRVSVWGGSEIDLTEQIPEHLCGAFELVIHSAVLGRTLSPNAAFDRIAALSSDLVVSVVAYEKPLEIGDMFTLTPSFMQAAHERNGLQVIYQAMTPDPETIDLVWVGSRRPERHALATEPRRQFVQPALQEKS